MKPADAYKRQLPKGVQDYLPEECFEKRKLEANLRRHFRLSGYDEVETPAFEYYHVFADGLSEPRRRSLIKWIDAQGDILALRPEWTTPIARMAATKVQEFPVRFCYIGNAYGCENAYYGSQMEFTQAGLELLGEPSPAADAEIIATAIESLRATGLDHFQIELGQVMFFKGLMEDAGLERDQIEALRMHIDQKNDLAVALFLQECEIDPRVQETIEKLSALFGGKEVFDQAEQFSANAKCRKAVQNLREIYGLLVDFGLEAYLLIDFGLLQSIDYYSGLIFKGYAESIGYPILSGGRYDHLIQNFGRDIPATGCAMGIKRIMIALEKQGKLAKPAGMDYIVAGKTPGSAYRAMQSLMAEGKRVQLALTADQNELTQRAAKIGAIPFFAE